MYEREVGVSGEINSSGKLREILSEYVHDE
jgi:hypothetical protein